MGPSQYMNFEMSTMMDLQWNVKRNIFDILVSKSQNKRTLHILIKLNVITNFITSVQITHIYFALKWSIIEAWHICLMELNEYFEDKGQHVSYMLSFIFKVLIKFHKANMPCFNNGPFQCNVNMFKARYHNTIKGLQCRVLMKDVTCHIRLWNFKIQEQSI
jgi:hypothetical protein